MTTKKNIRNSIVLSLLITTLCFPSVFSNVEANSLNLYATNHGMILPYNNSYLLMPEANVRFTINSTADLKEYLIKFNANYKIFNPNETTSTLIGAPFYYLDYWGIENLEVLANGTEIDSELFHIEFDENSTWFEYLSGSDQRDIFISNLTFYANTSLILNYSFDYKLPWKIGDIKFSLAEVWYDVGTARAWSGNVTETVEYVVYGHQPFYYNCSGRDETVRFYKDGIIEEIDDGYCYSWSWNNERIKEDQIEFRFSLFEEKLTPIDKMIMIIVFPSVGLVGLIFVSLRIIKVRRKRKVANP